MKSLQLTHLTYLPNPSLGYYTIHLQTDDSGHFELRIELYTLQGEYDGVIYRKLPRGLHTIQDVLAYANDIDTTGIFN